MKTRKLINILYYSLLFISLLQQSYGQYKPVEHRIPSESEIALNKAGSYDIPGATYVLTNDISSPRSAIFLGKDITLDLNGYTISYADGNYGHVKNYGFEEGLTGWDISKAPGAKIEDTEVTHAFIGKKILRLKAGDEIASEYVHLPAANRSYYAMCGITGSYYSDMKGDFRNDMRISIFVDDEQGKEVTCFTEYGDSARLSCPVIDRSARLGGGFAFAHLNNIPSGKYRIRIRAENDCLVDEIDIRPAMDVGIGIVEETHPLGHYDHLYNNLHSAFFDYTDDVTTGKPAEGIPVVKGSGTVTIKNGEIKNATNGILSRAIQSTAENVRIILDNIKISTSGINCTAVDVEQAVITKCTFNVENPFIINRHGAEFYAVDLRGTQPSEVSFSQFYGGQGCLSFRGDFSGVHHNYFVNHQTVTNHYSIMAMGDSSRIFENLFEPEIGSGIEVYVHRGIEIFNNEFHINAAPPSCEYHLHLSTNAIRLADYGAKPGSPRGCYGNRVYNNKFYITGKKYKQYPGYIPMASAFFYSASGGDNEIFGNNIIINQEDPESDAEAFAFYIGNSRGGKIYNNNIVSNVTPVWVACSYGNAENTLLAGNTISRSRNTIIDFKPVRMGSDEGSGTVARGTEFRSNILNGMEFGINKTGQDHSYSVFRTLKINLHDKKGNILPDTEIVITDKNGKEVVRGKSSREGSFLIELPEYEVDGNIKTYHSPYIIKSGKNKTSVDLNNNIEINLLIK